MVKNGLAELISQGLLKDGEVIVWKRRTGWVEDTIKSPGFLVTSYSVRLKRASVVPPVPRLSPSSL